MENLRERVETWLTEMGNPPEEQADPQANWHLGFTYPAGSGHRMHAAQPKDKPDAVVIATKTTISPNHVEAFEALPDDEKRNFQFGFRRTLNRMETDYRVEGVNQPSDCPQSFQISAVRFADGLTKDSFARTVGAVYKTELDGIFFVQERLMDRGLNGGGRFNFERLGV